MPVRPSRSCPLGTRRFHVRRAEGVRAFGHDGPLSSSPRRCAIIRQDVSWKSGQERGTLADNTRLLTREARVAAIAFAVRRIVYIKRSAWNVRRGVHAADYDATSWGRISSRTDLLLVVGFDQINVAEPVSGTGGQRRSFRSQPSIPPGRVRSRFGRPGRHGRPKLMLGLAEDAAEVKSRAFAAIRSIDVSCDSRLRQGRSVTERSLNDALTGSLHRLPESLTQRPDGQGRPRSKQLSEWRFLARSVIA